MSEASVTLWRENNFFIERPELRTDIFLIALSLLEDCVLQNSSRGEKVNDSGFCAYRTGWVKSQKSYERTGTSWRPSQSHRFPRD